MHVASMNLTLSYRSNTWNVYMRCQWINISGTSCLHWQHFDQLLPNFCCVNACSSTLFESLAERYASTEKYTAAHCRYYSNFPWCRKLFGFSSFCTFSRSLTENKCPVNDCRANGSSLYTRHYCRCIANVPAQAIQSSYDSMSRRITTSIAVETSCSKHWFIRI